MYIGFIGSAATNGEIDSVVDSIDDFLRTIIVFIGQPRGKSLGILFVRPAFMII